MTEKVEIVLRDSDVRKLREEYSDRVRKQSTQLRSKGRSGEELSESFREKYESAELSEIIGLLLADDLDIQYDI